MKLDLNAEYGREFVSKHIKTFTKEQLRDYFEFVGIQNLLGRYFISDQAFINMWNELDDECSKINEYFGGMKNAIIENLDRDADEDPIITFDKFYVNEVNGEVYESVPTLYFFDHLPVETITRIFEAHMDGDMEMLSFVTAAFCSADYETVEHVTTVMCAFSQYYSLYALDLSKSPRPFHDLGDRYLDFLTGFYEVIRANREKI
jgi:hypothetical protein